MAHFDQYFFKAFTRKRLLFAAASGIASVLSSAASAMIVTETWTGVVISSNAWTPNPGGAPGDNGVSNIYNAYAGVTYTETFTFDTNKGIAWNPGKAIQSSSLPVEYNGASGLDGGPGSQTNPGSVSPSLNVTFSVQGFSASFQGNYYGHFEGLNIPTGQYAQSGQTAIAEDYVVSGAMKTTSSASDSISQPFGGLKGVPTLLDTPFVYTVTLAETNTSGFFGIATSHYNNAVEGFNFQLAPTELRLTVAGGVPEPSTWTMMLLGFAGLSFAGYRQGRASATAPAA